MKTPETAPAGVLAKLRAQKAALEGHDEFTLPRSRVRVSMPRFREYEAWARAQQLGGADGAAINLYYIVAVCQFEGETLKAGDYRELIPADDHFVISGRLFNSAPDPTAAPGNG